MSATTARYLEASEYRHWNFFVEQSSSGSIYSTTDYLEALCNATSSDFQVIAAFRGDELFGGVALYRSRSRWGISVGNRSLLYYNGLVVRDTATKYPSHQTSEHISTLSAIEPLLADRRLGQVKLHHRSAVSDLRLLQVRGWSVTPTYSYTVDLTAIDVAYDRIDKNLRRLIRRAQSEGVQVAANGSFDAFYDLHEDVAKRKEAPLYLDRERFRTFYNLLREKNLATIYEASLPDGQIVAAQLVLLGKHPVSHTVCAGSRVEALQNGATPFLRWEAFRDLANRGYKGNDLTDASLNSVTKFKSDLGAKLELSLVSTRQPSAPFILAQAIDCARDYIRKLREN